MEQEKRTFFPENPERKKLSKLEKITLGAAIVAAVTAVGYGIYKLYQYIGKKKNTKY